MPELLTFLCASIREIARLMTQPGESPNRIYFHENFQNVSSVQAEKSENAAKRTNSTNAAAFVNNNELDAVLLSQD